MITRNALRAIALASSCLAPMATLAQTAATTPAPEQPFGMPITGDVGLGLMGVTGTNPNQAGRYNGLNMEGLDVVGQFDLQSRPAWDSGGVRYYSVWGDNLVFQTGNNLGSGIGNNNFATSPNNTLANAASVGLRVGDQGVWSAGAYYNAITYTGNAIDSIYTMSGAQGTLNNPLLPFGGATPTGRGTYFSAVTGTPSTPIGTQVSTLNNAMDLVQTGTRRNIMGGDVKYILGNWTFTGNFRHEHKIGSMEESIYEGGAYAGTAFALPIDYDTNRYDVTAAYTTPLYQGSLQYTLSTFNDNNLFAALPYPTSNTAAPWQRQAAYSLPPSNTAQYITLMLATNAVPKTRLNLNARVGWEVQNNTFAPNTADPSGTNFLGAPAGTFSGLNSALQGTTGFSPDITATVYQVKVSASSHPFANTDARVYYDIDGRNVTLNQFQVTTGATGGENSDSTPGLGAAGTNFAFVVPQNWVKQNAGFDVGYRFIPEHNTKLSIGYRFGDIDRSNAQVGHNITNTASIDLTSDLGDKADGKLSFIYSSRTGNLTYLGPWVWLGQGPSYSGAYYQAPMTSEAVKATLDYSPTNNLSGSLFVTFRNDNYTYPAATVANGGTVATLPFNGLGQGLKQDYALLVGPDLNWRPLKNVDVHFFYTYELLFYNNGGQGACSTAAQAAVSSLCAGTVGSFQNQQTSATNTFGVNGEWKVTDKLKLRGDYTLSIGSVMFSQFNGVFVPNPTASYQNVTNYPDINSTMNSLRLTATYDIAPNIQLIGQAAYSQFHNNDWNYSANAVQTYGATNTSILLTPGYSSPNYSVVALLGGVKFIFGGAPPPPPLAAPAPVAQAARSYMVFFDWDKAALTDRARQIIRQAADNSTHVQYTRIEVNGYTDTSGKPQYNQTLSIRRAEAVKAELVKDGVPVNAITTQGFGETHLLVPTANGVREPQNRRVEIVII